jgi:hypothetical protein
LRVKIKTATGPHGFIGRFFKTTWEIIKSDLMHTANYKLLTQFNLRNSAETKNSEAKCTSDFIAISLIDNIEKIISKLMTKMLPSCLDGLVSRKQCVSTHK